MATRLAGSRLQSETWSTCASSTSAKTGWFCFFWKMLLAFPFLSRIWGRRCCCHSEGFYICCDRAFTSWKMFLLQCLALLTVHRNTRKHDDVFSSPCPWTQHWFLNKPESDGDIGYSWSIDMVRNQFLSIILWPFDVYQSGHAVYITISVRKYDAAFWLCGLLSIVCHRAATRGSNQAIAPPKFTETCLVMRYNSRL